MIISRTPFRVSLFGGGTDYPAWFRKNGGEVLATTINKYCYLTCRYLPPFFEHRIRLVYSRIENRHSIEEVEHPAVRAVLQYLKFDRGLELHHDADLPARSGMGTSSAFTVGLLHALYALTGRMTGKQELATQSIYIEQELLKETVGCQDQILAAFGGFNHIEFRKNGSFAVHPVTLPAERIRELESHLMLCYSGIKRTAAEIAGSFVPDMERREPQLRALRDTVRAGIAVLNSADDIARIGELLDEAWRAKRGLSEKVTNEDVDRIYDDARAAGAVGGKVLGAGGGGFMLLLVPPARQPAVRERLNRLIHVPLRFESLGSQIIFSDPEEDHAATEAGRRNQDIRVFRELVEPTGT
jgi:D-glycero-alpha-D-manno-heptose-7-phosphate kinase